MKASLAAVWKMALTGSKQPERPVRRPLWSPGGSVPQGKGTGARNVAKEASRAVRR